MITFLDRNELYVISSILYNIYISQICGFVKKYLHHFIIVMRYHQIVYHHWHNVFTIIYLFIILFYSHQIQWYHLLFIIYIRNSNHSILTIPSINPYSTNRSSNSTINRLWFISHHSFNHHFHLLVNWFHSIHIQISFHLFHILVHYHQ